MKIIKPGDPDRLKAIKQFECRYCGCFFEADNTEYKEGPQTDPGYYCKCPTCGRMVDALDCNS